MMIHEYSNHSFISNSKQTLLDAKKSSIHGFLSLKKAVYKIMKKEFNDDNFPNAALQEKAKVVTEDGFLFKKLKEELKEQQVATNFAIKEVLGDVLEGLHFTAKSGFVFNFHNVVRYSI